MTPQSFPLEAWTKTGERVLVVGWARAGRWTTDERGDATAGATLAPVVVSLEGPDIGAQVYTGEPLAFLSPSDSTR